MSASDKSHRLTQKARIDNLECEIDMFKVQFGLMQAQIEDLRKKLSGNPFTSNIPYPWEKITDRPYLGRPLEVTSLRVGDGMPPQIQCSLPDAEFHPEQVYGRDNRSLLDEHRS